MLRNLGELLETIFKGKPIFRPEFEPVLKPEYNRVSYSFPEGEIPNKFYVSDYKGPSKIIFEDGKIKIVKENNVELPFMNEELEDEVNNLIKENKLNVITDGIEQNKIIEFAEYLNKFNIKITNPYLLAIFGASASMVIFFSIINTLKLDENHKYKN